MNARYEYTQVVGDDFAQNLVDLPDFGLAPCRRSSNSPPDV
jgi:hypothetical protein